ncbi:hypothetical protein [Fibrella arboris]|uniref:hypothetical protein n=1 Tax=Fibrella arboris TaxID=3242486 RepID=UPI003520903E
MKAGLSLKNQSGASPAHRATTPVFYEKALPEQVRQEGDESDEQEKTGRIARGNGQVRWVRYFFVELKNILLLIFCCFSRHNRC